MDPDDERILELEFADDNLESMGYERPVSGPLVLYNQDQQQHPEESAAVGVLQHHEDLLQAIRPEADLARSSEPKPLLNAGNLNINISVNSEDAHRRRRAALPSPMGARADRAGADGNGGIERERPRHTRLNRAVVLPFVIFLCILAGVCVFLISGGRSHQRGPVQFSSAHTEAPLPIAPGAFSRAYENLEQDLAQLEELFYRARSALPPASSLRHLLEDGPQPQALRKEVEALGGIHEQLVGRASESDIARNLRVSNSRLRAVATELHGERGRWGSSRSSGVVGAEKEHAKAMTDTVANIITDIEATRTRCASVCRRRPFVDARGSWALSDSSTCPKEENRWELTGGSTMSLGNGASDAKATFGFIDWICRDLDALTAGDKAGRVAGSVAVEARLGLDRWKQLLRGWNDLEASLNAN